MGPRAAAPPAAIYLQGRPRPTWSRHVLLSVAVTSLREVAAVLAPPPLPTKEAAPLRAGPREADELEPPASGHGNVCAEGGKGYEITHKCGLGCERA